MVKVGVVGICPKVWAFLNFATRANNGSINSPLSMYTNEKFRVEVVGVLAELSEYKKLNLWGVNGEFPLVSEFNDLVNELGAEIIISCSSKIKTIIDELSGILDRGIKLVIVDEPSDESIKRKLSELKGKILIFVGDLVGYLDVEIFSTLIHDYLNFLLDNVSVSTLKFTSRLFQKKPSEKRNNQSYNIIIPRNINPDVNYSKSIMTKKIGDKFISISIDAEYSYVFSLGAKIFDLILAVKILEGEFTSDDLISDLEVFAFYSANMNFNQYFYSLRRVFELVKQVISSGRKV